jgi:LPS-assembly protein
MFKRLWHAMFFFMVLGTYLTAFNPLTAEETIPESAFEDWVVDKSRSLCRGLYRQPDFSYYATQNPSGQTTITANSAEFMVDGPSIFKGNIFLQQPGRQVQADFAKIYRDEDTHRISKIDAVGHVKILEPDIRLEGNKAEIDWISDTKTLSPASFRLYKKHARGTASRLSSKGDSWIELQNARYTTCEPGKDTWILAAKSVVLNKQAGRGVAKHAWLEVKSMPVFYFPYVDFPIDDRRKTGFLYPSYASSNQSGRELSVPIYWNMAPNYDLTLTPRWLSKRGFEIGGNFRGLTQHQKVDIKLNFLPYDDRYAAFRQENLANHPEFSDNDPRVLGLKRLNNHRYYFGFQHQAAIDPNWHSTFDYQTVSDDNYFMDFSKGFYGLDTNYLKQRAEVQYVDAHWQVKTLAQQYKVLHPFNGPAINDVYRKLPEISADYFNVDLPMHFSMRGNASFTYFSHKVDPSTGLASTTGDRYYLRPAISWNYVTPGWFIKPRLQWHLASYHLSLSNQDQSLQRPNRPGIEVPMLDINSGLIFSRNTHFRKEAFVQTLEPRLYYLYVPFRDQARLPNFDSGFIPFDYYQLYADNRFSGSDRVGDTHQITLGVESQLLTEADQVERLEIGVGQIFYFNSRQVTACNPNVDAQCPKIELPHPNRHRSPIAGQASYAWNTQWRSILDLQWNTYRKSVDKTGLSVQYRPMELNVLNVGFGYIGRNPIIIDPTTGKPERIFYGDISSIWSVTEQIRLLGHWAYDIHHRQSKTTLVGFEYEGCCIATRFSFIRTLQPFAIEKVSKKYVDRFSLQLVFKGFAGVGSTNMNDNLRKEIPGYVSRGEVF